MECLKETMKKCAHYLHQETSLTNNRALSLSDPFTPVLFWNNISYSPISYHGLLQVTAIRVSLNNDVTVCSIYITPKYSLNMSELNALFHQLPFLIFLLGDINGTSIHWGYSSSNPCGNLVANFIATNDLYRINDSHGHSVIQALYSDLSLNAPSNFLIFTGRY